MTRTAVSRGRPAPSIAAAAVLALTLTSCLDSTGPAPGRGEERASEAAAAFKTGTPEAGSVGLAVEIEDGTGAPLRLRAGQRFHLNQVDLRAAVTASTDEGVAGLDAAGDFAGLDWSGVAVRDTELVATPNADGTFTRRRFYRGAAWMEDDSELVLTQVDASGNTLAPPVKARAGKDDKHKPRDAFFVRRMRAIQWTYDCASPADCSSATNFAEEALVELRHATGQSPAFTLHPGTAALRLHWSARPGSAYSIPVTQEAAPQFEYGAIAELAAVTPLSPGGFYLPGQDVSFHITLRDGAGNRLHPPGSLPSYADVVFGLDDTGIQYWRGVVEPSATYWRRKHREAMLAVQLIGPAQDIQPIRSVMGFEQLFLPFATTGFPVVDGVLAESAVVPPAPVILLGLWDQPASDVVTFHLTDDAQPGTYLVTVKGRRRYLGEDIPFSTTIEIPVGTAQPTSATLDTGPCNSCHSGGGALDVIGHALDNRAACAGCHAPLVAEPEGPLFVRLHYIHSRSDRVDAPAKRCASCHLTAESIQRTSKAACLSCHTSYPDDHVAAFGPVTSSYVGGGFESFDQCTGTCHTTHPGSAL